MDSQVLPWADRPGKVGQLDPVKLEAFHHFLQYIACCLVAVIGCVEAALTRWCYTEMRNAFCKLDGALKNWECSTNKEIKRTWRTGFKGFFGSRFSPCVCVFEMVSKRDLGT